MKILQSDIAYFLTNSSWAVEMLLVIGVSILVFACCHLLATSVHKMMEKQEEVLFLPRPTLNYDEQDKLEWDLTGLTLNPEQDQFSASTMS